MYAALGRRLFDAADQEGALDVIEDLKRKLRERVPSLEEVQALFPQIIYTENVTKRRDLVRYTLAGFSKVAKGRVPLDYDAMTIEHLVPQSAIGSDGYTDEIVGQIGNLILVSPELNVKLGDKPFRHKKRILEQTPGYEGLADIYAAAEWTPQDIEKRTLALAKEAYGATWRI